ncbi:SDR family oxidoreductase [Candidatus Peregrinibacteria bacterium]|jgi:3-oxoacyl-[acyl-carrier protein] reductase|nr:SDR family oxidoreductase [Candidatus Peregrinibacteria bacterium]
MNKDLANKTVLITGTSRGIGKAIAQAFLEQGTKVIALYREEKPEFEGSHEVIFLKADIQDLDTIRTWLSEFENDGGKIDVLVNNAGVYSKCDLLNVTEEDFDRTMSINLKGTVFLSQLIAIHMKKNGSGSIVNAASFAAQLASRGFGIYAATKTAIISLTKSMAAEFAPYGIRVNAFSPGVTPTRMTQPAIDANEKGMLDTIALHRFGGADEVANAVLFLASDASSYITGTNLDVSGGKFANQNPGASW